MTAYSKFWICVDLESRMASGNITIRSEPIQLWAVRVERKLISQFVLFAFEHSMVIADIVAMIRNGDYLDYMESVEDGRNASSS